MSDSPLVSILIPAFNSQDYIEELIDSLIAQSYTNLEILVCDDQSSDQTYEILQKKAQGDQRLKVFKNDQNQGISKTRNDLFEKSSGEFIATADADDVNYPQRIEKQLHFLKENPDVDIVGSRYKLLLEGKKSEPFNHVFRYTHEDISRQLKFLTAIPHFTMFARRHVYEKVSYRSELPASVDYDFQLVALSKGLKFANLKETLVTYRIHNNSVGSSRRLEQLLGAYLARKLYDERLKYNQELTKLSPENFKLESYSWPTQVFLKASLGYQGHVLSRSLLNKILQLLMAPFSEMGRFFLRRKLYFITSKRS